MYLHLGQSVAVPFRDVVGIFDADHATASHLTRAFLKGCEEAGRVVDISGELPKSLVLCAEPGGWRVYLSQLAPATLLRRAESGAFE